MLGLGGCKMVYKPMEEEAIGLEPLPKQMLTPTSSV